MTIKNKQLLMLLVLVLSTVVLALAVIFIPKQIIFRQKAAFGTAGLHLAPASNTYPINKKFSLQLFIDNPNTLKISAYTIYLTFDPSKLEITNFANGEAFPIVDSQANDPERLGRTSGRAVLEALNMGSNLSNEAAILAATIKVKGKVVGENVPLAIVEADSVLVGENPDASSTDVDVAIGEVGDGTYTFTSGETGTPTPTTTPGAETTPTPTSTPTATPTPTSTPTVTPTPGCRAVNKVIQVTPLGGAGTCHDIQLAVDAVTGDGFTVKLAAGEYNVPDQNDFSVKVVNKSNLTIQGVSQETMVTGDVMVSFNGNRGGFYFENSSGKLRWLSIPGRTSSGLIYVRNSSNLELTYLKIVDDSMTAIRIDNSDNIKIMNNLIKSYIIGIYPFLSTNISIAGNTIYLSGTGVEASSSSGEIKDNLVSDARDVFVLLDNNRNNFDIHHNTFVSVQEPVTNNNVKVNNVAVKTLTNGIPYGVMINKASKFRNNIIASTSVKAGDFVYGGLLLWDGVCADFASSNINHNDFYNVDPIFWSGNESRTRCDFTHGANGNIAANPLFGDNFCLQDGSPAIYGDVSNEEFMGEAWPCGQDSGVALNFKVKFQGITQKRDDQQVKLTVKRENFSKPFDVRLTSNDSGIYSGSVALTGVAPGNYLIYIKGPRHLAKKFCKNNQETRCSLSDRIALVRGDNTLDFSKMVLEGGDLPNPNDDYKQDGVVNSIDYTLINNRLGSSAEDDLRIADINLDGAVNSTDRILLRNTLETRYEEDN